MGRKQGRWRKEPWRERGQGEGQQRKRGNRGMEEGSGDPRKRRWKMMGGEPGKREAENTLGKARPPKTR